MAIEVSYWNKQFTEYFDQHRVARNLAKDYGITVYHPRLQDNEVYWACVGVRHLTGRENMGNHNIFCDVLDENNNRINGAVLKLKQDGQAPVTARVDKPHYEPGTNFPIWGTPVSEVSVFDVGGLKSTTADGFRINHPDEDVGNTIGHHSFYIVFKRCRYKADAPAPPTPIPIPEPEKPKGSNGEKVIRTESLSFQIEDDYQIDVVIVVKALGD